MRARLEKRLGLGGNFENERERQVMDLEGIGRQTEQKINIHKPHMDHRTFPINMTKNVPPATVFKKQRSGRSHFFKFFSKLK
jgi:hypothetical protein